jgi:hypothetical protein
MNIIEEKLKFIMQSELSNDFSLNYLYVDDYDDNNMSLEYSVKVQTDPNDNKHIINILKNLDKVMTGVLSRYKFQPNGKMLRSEKSRVFGVISKIKYVIDDDFEIDGAYHVVWE